MWLGGIDAGGFSFKCAIATADGKIVAKNRFPFSTPENIVRQCTAFFAEHAELYRIDRLGLSCFGPINIDAKTKHYGQIGKTTKEGWSNFNFAKTLEAELGLPVIFHTDVYGALLAENRWGACQNTDTSAYVTIGAGIGLAAKINQTIVGTPQHPEYGHIRVARHSQDTFQGTCPFHSDCLEGLASATAFSARWGEPKLVEPDHIGWDFEAYYLAQATYNILLLLRPQKVVFGGGLSQARGLIERVRDQVGRLLGGYLNYTQDDLKRILVKSALGDESGLLGAIALASENH